MMDLEDGELHSDDDDEATESTNTNITEFPDFLHDSDYVILDRPKSKYPESSASVSTPLPVSAPSSTASSVPSIGNADGLVKDSQFPGSFQNQSQNPLLFSFDGNYGGRKAYYNNLGVSDLLESSDKDSSPSSSDSDDDNFGKKSRMTFPPKSNSAPVDSRNDMDMNCYPALLSSDFTVSSSTSFNASAVAAQPGLSLFQAAASSFQKQRKPNTIWSNVIQEEQISNSFDRVKVEEPSFSNIEVERGPETYSFQRPQRQPRVRRDSDSSDISSEGLSDNALHYLRDGISYNEDETGESSEHSLPQSFTSRSTKKTGGTKRRRTNSKLKRKVLNKLKKMKSPDLAQYMATKLKEEKVTLLGRAVEVLGKEKCIHIFIKTLKIEKRGGLMVKNQERRRTPGGVFLYLIRGDRRFPKSQIDLIFQNERVFHDRKKRVAVNRSKRKAKLEAQKNLVLGSAMKVRDDSYSDDTAVPDRDQDGTDTGQLGDDSTTDKDKDTTTEEFSGYGEMQCDGSES